MLRRKAADSPGDYGWVNRFIEMQIQRWFFFGWRWSRHAFLAHEGEDEYQIDQSTVSRPVDN